MRLRDYSAELGSMSAYFQKNQPRARDQEGFYDMVKRYLVTEPYKGWSVLGFLGGLAAGTVFGPLGALFTGLVGAGITGGYATAYHWIWGRGKRQSGNPEFDISKVGLRGQSLGKFFADYIDHLRAQARQQPQSRLALQPAYV